MTSPSNHENLPANSGETEPRNNTNIGQTMGGIATAKAASEQQTPNTDQAPTDPAATAHKEWCKAKLAELLSEEKTPAEAFDDIANRAISQLSTNEITAAAIYEIVKNLKKDLSACASTYTDAWRSIMRNTLPNATLQAELRESSPAYSIDSVLDSQQSAIDKFYEALGEERLRGCIDKEMAERRECYDRNDAAIKHSTKRIAQLKERIAGHELLIDTLRKLNSSLEKADKILTQPVEGGESSRSRLQKAFEKLYQL